MRLAIRRRVRRHHVIAAVIGNLGACATSSSPCEEAAAQLAACSQDQRAAFASACEASGGADPSALDADDAATACTAPPSDGKADAQTTAEIGLCVAGMYGVKWAVTALSPAGQPLSADTKTMLRPLYGSLVDDVTLTIGATLPPRVVIAGHRLGVQPDAMTFGDHIYMLQQVADDTRAFDRLLLTTTHELTHARQARQAGGFYGFAVAYCRDMVAAGFSYDHIGMEVAAYAVEGIARRSLQSCGRVVCP